MKVSTRVEGATYTAELHPDGTVSVWMYRVSFVGEGRWVGHEIEIRSRLISEATRVRLSRALAAGMRARRQPQTLRPPRDGQGESPDVPRLT